MRSATNPAPAFPRGVNEPIDRRGTGAGAARTPLGARLALLREAVVASGVPLLGWEELDAEVSERRGRSGEEE
jgi:hypothetical protein